MQNQSKQATLAKVSVEAPIGVIPHIRKKKKVFDDFEALIFDNGESNSKDYSKTCISHAP